MDTYSPLILIADASELSRSYIANILKPAGYDVMQAVDGGSALKVVSEHQVDMAIIDHYMAPYGGFEFATKLQNDNIRLPMLMVTNEETSDLLIEASRRGIGGYLRKPVDPQRLLTAVRRLLREQALTEGKSQGQAIGSEIAKTSFSPEELMQRAVFLAQRNAELKQGGPYGAVVADAQGRILGEGVNGITSRCDPVAHAEVMAIRQATERLNRTDLEDCILYTSSEPTAIGKALIDSVGLAKVYYGLSHEDLKPHLQENKKYSKADYTQLLPDHALQMIKANAKSE